MHRAAFFDVDGTLARTNIAKAYVQIRLGELSLPAKVLWVPFFACKGLLYLLIDSFDRALFNRLFYRNYRGRRVATAPELARVCFERYYRPRILPEAREQVKTLQEKGYRVVLVTGSLDFLVAPLAEEFGIRDVIASELEAEGDRFTGKLKGDPLSDTVKADKVREFAESEGLSLGESHAYGDSIADLPMLEAAGHPHAVSPDSRLRSIANDRSWPILEWA